MKVGGTFQCGGGSAGALRLRKASGKSGVVVVEGVWGKGDLGGKEEKNSTHK